MDVALSKFVNGWISVHIHTHERGVGSIYWQTLKHDYKSMHGSRRMYVGIIAPPYRVSLNLVLHVIQFQLYPIKILKRVWSV